MGPLDSIDCPSKLYLRRMSEYMTKTAWDEVELHSHEKNPEPSVAL